MRTSTLATWVAVCGSMFVATAANAASDYFLKIEGVEGEAAASSRDGQIEVSSYSWGVSQAAVTAPRDAASGQASGKRQHKPITVISPPLDATAAAPAARAAVPQASEVKTLSLLVPEPGNDMTAQLVRMCASGQHIKKAVLTGPDTRYEMEDVVVSSCAVSGDQRKIEFTGHVTLMK